MKIYTARKVCQILILAAFFLPIVLFAQEQKTVRVLFVGNSYTYFWNLPQTVSLMAESQNTSIEAFQSTAGGVSLEQHWNGEKELQTRKLIEDGEWDYVILQNHSLSAINDLDNFMIYGKKFGELIRHSGAKPLLYMTWSRQFNPLMQDAITEAYNILGEEIEAEVVPVGQAWLMARELRPDLILYDKDGSHPSTLGTYLTACLFFNSITTLQAQGLPNRLITEDKSGEKLYLAILDSGDASFLQQVADQVGMKEADENK